MEIGLIVLTQTLTMFLLMALGIALYRAKVITDTGSAELSKLLITVIIPAAILKSYAVKYTAEKGAGLVYSSLYTAVSLLLAMAICHFFYGSRRRIDNFGVSFSNAGFVGIPLVSAVLGEENIFFVAIYVALLNFLQQTYGVMVMTGERRAEAGKIAKNPVLLSLLAGIAVFYLQIPVPKILTSCISFVAGLNTPVAMIVLGVFLAQTSFLEIITDRNVMTASFYRLILIPAVTLLVLIILPGPGTIKLVVLIAAATPIGSNVAVFARLYGQDYTYAVKTVCASTLYSIITLPLIVAAASHLFH